MKFPLANAAKRGEVLIFVPITVAGPRVAPIDCRYFLSGGASVETDPASARPSPSRIDFLPSATTSEGISSYRVFTMKSET
jgi:hypothetical protein